MNFSDLALGGEFVEVPGREFVDVPRREYVEDAGRDRAVKKARKRKESFITVERICHDFNTGASKTLEMRGKAHNTVEDAIAVAEDKIASDFRTFAAKHTTRWDTLVELKAYYRPHVMAHYTRLGFAPKEAQKKYDYRIRKYLDPIFPPKRLKKPVAKRRSPCTLFVG